MNEGSVHKKLPHTCIIILMLISLVFSQVVVGLLHNHSSIETEQNHEDTHKAGIHQSQAKCMACSLHVCHELYCDLVVSFQFFTCLFAAAYIFILAFPYTFSLPSKGRSPPVHIELIAV